jgi:hypothetical protein
MTVHGSYHLISIIKIRSRKIEHFCRHRPAIRLNLFIFKGKTKRISTSIGAREKDLAFLLSRMKFEAYITSNDISRGQSYNFIQKPTLFLKSPKLESNLFNYYICPLF